mgnify:CR=1 FL=1
MIGIDQPTELRPGEELDEKALREYLSSQLDQISALAPLQLQQFPGGHSNLSYLITQGEQELVLRKPPLGSKVKSAHDMGREYRVLSKLGPTHSRAPTPLLYCQDSSIIGSSFYLMERVRGFILRKDFPDDVPSRPELLQRMCTSFVQTLADLHAVDYQRIGLGELGRPEGYVERQVQGWSKRYQDAKTHEVPTVDFLAAWLGEHMPANAPQATLIHNDFKFDNLVLAPKDLSEVLGILDWEMTTLGDPLMDLGTALGYWVQANDSPAMHSLRFGPTHLPGMMSRQELAEAYASLTGCPLEHILFYYVFGLFKSIGVVQQIYYRFHKGLTKDARFASFIDAVRALSDQANLAIERQAL